VSGWNAGVSEGGGIDVRRGDGEGALVSMT
jgi:hypothetical protein